MRRDQVALVLLLVACATCSEATAPRALLQGRSPEAPGQSSDPGIPQGRPEDVAAVGEPVLIKLKVTALQIAGVRPGCRCATGPS